MNKKVRAIRSKTVAPLVAPSNETEEALRSIFLQYNDTLNRFIARRIGCQEDVPGIAQEVYLRLVRIASNEAIRQPLALIFRITRNLLNDRARRQAIHAVDRHVSMGEIKLVCSSPSPEEILESKQTLKIIENTLMRLKPEAEQAFILHRYKGLTYDKIASEMGISKRRVRHYISSTLVKLREALGEIS